MKNALRSPLTSKRALREKSAIGKSTFALTADVSEAHRQVLIHQSRAWPELSGDSRNICLATFLARGVFWCRTTIISKPGAQSIAEH